MFRPRTKPISEILQGKVSKLDFILNNLSLYYTLVIRNHFVWIIFYSGVWFLFYFTVPSLNFSKSYKFSNVTYKVKSNMSDPLKRREKSHHGQTQTVADLSDLA